jgi:hypothetical protein
VSSPGEELMTCNTSAVAVCCSETLFPAALAILIGNELLSEA